jgi:hypothetical protein
VSGLLQSSYTYVPRVIFPPFVLTFAVAIAITVLNSVGVGLVCTAMVVRVVMITYRSDTQPVNANAVADTAIVMAVRIARVFTLSSER